MHKPRPPARAFTLARLLAEVTEENRHHEVETGPAVHEVAQKLWTLIGDG